MSRHDNREVNNGTIRLGLHSIRRLLVYPVRALARQPCAACLASTRHTSRWLRLEVKDLSGRKVLAKLRPVKQGGADSFGTQTHPADGNSGMIVTSRERARE